MKIKTKIFIIIFAVLFIGTWMALSIVGVIPVKITIRVCIGLIASFIIGLAKAFWELF